MEEEIGCELTGNSGYFYAKTSNLLEAKLTFFFSANKKMIVDHIEIKPSSKGKGLGRKLIRTAVEFARENGIKILPLCPYTKSILFQTPEFKDVL